MKLVLLATYEMGRQPFGLASPAAWLGEAGAEVVCADLSRETLPEAAVREADLVAFYVPMHTATRLAVECVDTVQQLNPRAHLCFYGLYAPVNEAYLRKLGVETILGGEFEEGLVSLVQRLAIASGAAAPEKRMEPAFSAERKLRPANIQPEVMVSLRRQKFRVPERRGLVPLSQYAHLVLPTGEHRTVGYTEASRGCKHLCRHCPIVPVYQGVFRIVQPEVVLADIRQQVAAGAKHITFGDPDFFNGPGHALAIVEQLHREFPRLTYDVTIKIEHLLRQAPLMRTLKETGCLFVTSAVESVDDAALERLDKGHTRADFLAVLELMREQGLELHPTFVPFTPWTTLEGYLELLEVIAQNDLVENVAPIQLAIRLLIPAGSRLLELGEVRKLIAPFDEAGLVYPWAHPDARVDALCDEVQEIVRAGEKVKRSRAQTLARIWEAARATAGETRDATRELPVLASRATIPYLDEPWYC
jgi:radical SAM superfamily enzyme YgiQ (UPF0313 family)